MGYGCFKQALHYETLGDSPLASFRGLKIVKNQPETFIKIFPISLAQDKKQSYKFMS